MPRNAKLLVAACFGSVLICGAAQAGTVFLGSTITAEHDYDTLGSIFAGPQSALVGSGTEFNFVSTNAYTIDVSDTNLFWDFTVVNFSTFNSASFNGTVIKDSTNSVPSFASVTINAATNMAGFDSSRISFTANQINVNFQGLSFNSNTVVSLDVTAASAVPLPSSALMGLALLAGLGGFTWLGTRRGTATAA